MLKFQLTSLLSEVGLNIQEAHAFSTTDGYSLDVFVVDGWALEVHYPFFSFDILPEQVTIVWGGMPEFIMLSIKCLIYCIKINLLINYS